MPELNGKYGNVFAHNKSSLIPVIAVMTLPVEAVVSGGEHRRRAVKGAADRWFATFSSIVKKQRYLRVFLDVLNFAGISPAAQNKQIL